MLIFKEISAKDNRLVKLISLLQKSSKARKENNLFVLEGLRICKDAAENGIKFDTIVLSKTVYNDMSKDVTVLCKNAKNGVLLSDDLFKKISNTTSPQGIITLCQLPENTEQIDIHGRYIALENIADPANVGAIARTAEALGMGGIIIAGNTCDVYSPKALRASMGTILRMPLYFCDDVISFLNNNLLRGFACVPEKNAELSFGSFGFSDGDVLIIGNEANGLSELTKKNAYKTIRIEMKGRAESLNAASAAAIAMWELIK